MRISVLGSGTSTGIPYIGCACDVCTSPDPKDRRQRCCSLVETDDGKRILLDCGPDFREQMLRLYHTPGSGFEPHLYTRSFYENPDKRLIDAVFLTHNHYDHIGGLDDMRPGIFGNVEIYAEEEVIQSLHHRLPYCFPDKHKYPGTPDFHVHTINMQQIDSTEDILGKIAERSEENALDYLYKELTPLTAEETRLMESQAVQIGRNKVVPLRVYHGKENFRRKRILGYRIGGLAYITDMRSYPLATLRYLCHAHIDTLFVNLLRYREHPTHQNFEQAVRFARSVGARQTFFIHMCHEIGLHEKAEQRLQDYLRDTQCPPQLSMHYAYDGEVIDIRTH